jgi:crotonobetainyl-CoA:carnitine CoA-transferase CaiB-like acyl-CoA transferase
MLLFLSGIRVLAQGTFITGPATGMFPDDFGAEWIKVEQPVSGNPFRIFWGGLFSPHSQIYNRNQRSITRNPELPDEGWKSFRATCGKCAPEKACSTN